MPRFPAVFALQEPSGGIVSVSSLLGRAARAAATIAILGGTSACGVGCDALGIPALRVDVRDAAAGQPLAWRARLITLRDNGRADTASLGDGAAVPPGDTAAYLTLTANTFAAATYKVTVQRSGYQDWVRDGVRVPEDDCGQPKPVRLEARLEALLR